MNSEVLRKILIYLRGEHYGDEMVGILHSALRIIGVRNDLIPYAPHICSADTCMPRSELYYINGKLLDRPVVSENVFVCNRFVIHVCMSSSVHREQESVNLKYPFPISFRISWSCSAVSANDDSTMVCNISRRYLSRNFDALSFDTAFTVSDKSGSNNGDEHDFAADDAELSNTVNDDGEGRISHVPSDSLGNQQAKLLAVCKSAALQMIDHIFVSRRTRTIYRKLRDMDLRDAMKAIIQSEKSMLNAKFRPNLFMIIAVVPQQFKNITMDCDFPPPSKDIKNQIVDAVLHCVLIYFRARSSDPRSGYNRFMHTGNALRYSLAIIYSMRNGITLADRTIIPRVEYVNRYAPRITVLYNIGIQRATIIQEEHHFTKMCRQFLADGQPLAHLEYTQRMVN